MALADRAASIHERLVGLGHDVDTVRTLNGRAVVILNSGDQAAADADLADIVATAPDQAERVRTAARRVGVTPRVAALSHVIVARIDGLTPDSWAVAVLRQLNASVDAELET